jgi:chemotaxis protein histidine kinase CheA
MKGMARTFRLIDLADAFHRFEDLLEVKKNQGITSTVSSATLRERLGDARKILQLYMEVNKNVLGRVQADDAQQDSKNWVRRKVARLRQVDTSLLPPAHRHLMEAVLLDMERHTSLSLEYTLSELILSMPQQASLLGRAVPEIHFRECGARLTSLGQTLTEKIFVHILNNSLDHGIESPDRRTALGKPKRGTIDIVSYLEGGNLRIEVSDDGMGLNLPRIERRAFERHYFEEGQDLTPEEIADVIFEPGFSTKDELSPVSGRGVGLDAVRAYLMNVDGSIRVEFTGPISSHGVAPFKLVLLYSQDLWISTGLEREANDGNDAA